MKERIKECHRCLKPNGNIVIHIEPKISHYFRFICDEIFGVNNFKNEIVADRRKRQKFISTESISYYYNCLFQKWKKCIYNLYVFLMMKNIKKSSVKFYDIHKKEEYV